MKRKQPRPVAPVAVDPNAPVFEIGDRIEVRQRVLWTGYRGKVSAVEGGMCRCRLFVDDSSRHAFFTYIPAAELKKL